MQLEFVQLIVCVFVVLLIAILCCLLSLFSVDKKFLSLHRHVAPLVMHVVQNCVSHVSHDAAMSLHCLHAGVVHDCVLLSCVAHELFGEIFLSTAIPLCNFSALL